MGAFLKAAQFIMQSQTGKHLPIRRQTISLGGHPADVYRPALRRPHGTVLVVHGMTIRGKDDIRMVNICSAMAGCGFTALAPQYDTIAKLKIIPENIDQIRDSIVAIAAAPSICEDRRMGLFSASFSAGMSLIAAARPETAAHVSSACMVGTLGDVDTTIRFLIGHDNTIDDYGTMIVLSNFIEKAVGPNPELARAFEIAAYDNGLARENPELPAYVAALSHENRELFYVLQKDSSERLRMWDRIVSGFAEFPQLRRDLSVISRLDGMKAAVCLIHGMDDNVIPPSESEMVYRRLSELNVPAKLTLTPLISHGHASIGPSMVVRAAELASAFSFFFAHI